MIASAYVGIHPEKVKKAVLIEPGFLKGTLAKEFMEAGGPGFMDMLKIAGVWFNKWRVDTDGDPHARDDYFMGAAYAHVVNPDLFCDGKFPKDMGNWRFGTAVFKATAAKAMDDPEFLASLDYAAGSENFGGEVLLVAAECNKLIGPDYQRRHLQFFKNARMEIIPAAGHFMLYDNPGYTNRVIADFFSGSLDVISQENQYE